MQIFDVARVCLWWNSVLFPFLGNFINFSHFQQIFILLTYHSDFWLRVNFFSPQFIIATFVIVSNSKLITHHRDFRLCSNFFSKQLVIATFHIVSILCLVTYHSVFRLCIEIYPDNLSYRFLTLRQISVW